MLHEIIFTILGGESFIYGCLKTVFLCFDTLRHYKKWLFEKLVLTSICEMKLVLQPTFLSVPVLWRLLLWRGDYCQCVSTLETCVITECIQHILWQPDTGGRVQRYLLFSATQHQGSNNQAAVQISVNKHLPWPGSSLTPANNVQCSVQYRFRQLQYLSSLQHHHIRVSDDIIWHLDGAPSRYVLGTPQKGPWRLYSNVDLILTITPVQHSITIS